MNTHGIDDRGRFRAPVKRTPNNVSTQAPTYDLKHYLPPLHLPYEMSAFDAVALLKQLMSQHVLKSLIREEIGGYLHYEVRSRLLGFTDDVEFVVNEEQRKVHFRSASRIGHSDLGANRKRMQKVVNAWNKVMEEEGLPQHEYREGRYSDIYGRTGSTGSVKPRRHRAMSLPPPEQMMPPPHPPSPSMYPAQPQNMMYPPSPMYSSPPSSPGYYPTSPRHYPPEQYGGPYHQYPQQHQGTYSNFNPSAQQFSPNNAMGSWPPQGDRGYW